MVLCEVKHEPEAINASFAESEHFLKPEEEPAWQKVWYGMMRDAGEFEAAFKTMEEQFAARYAGSIELERLALSWNDTQEVHGFALMDPDGAVVAERQVRDAAEWWLDKKTMAKDELVDYLTQLVWGGLAGAGLDRLQTDD